MAKGLPVEVHLRRLSLQHNIHAIMFKLFDEFWHVDGASILADRVVLVRTDESIVKKIRENPGCLTPMVPNKYGVNAYGCACPIKKIFTKANLMRYIRHDPRRHLLGVRRKLKVAAMSSGRMMVVAGTKEAHVAFNDQKKIPVWITRAMIRLRKRKLSPYPGNRFLLDVYGTLLRSLDDVVERVMQDTTVFVDPLEMKRQGNRQCIVLRWNSK